jgi:hypothetical protein
MEAARNIFSLLIVSDEPIHFRHLNFEKFILFYCTCPFFADASVHSPST